MESSSSSATGTTEQIGYTTETDAAHNTTPKRVEIKSSSHLVKSAESSLTSSWFKIEVPDSSKATFDFVSAETGTTEKTIESTDGVDKKFELLSGYDVVTVKDIIGTESHVSSQESNTDDKANPKIAHQALHVFLGKLYHDEFSKLDVTGKEIESFIMNGNYAVPNKTKKISKTNPFTVSKKLDDIAKDEIAKHRIKVKKASSMIARNYKKYRVNLEEKITQAHATPERQTPESKIGLVTMFKKDYSQKPPVITETYYFDVKGKLPPVRHPKNVDQNFKTIKGGTKEMIAADDEFVLLRDIQGKAQSKTKVQLMELQRELSKYSAISRSVPISANTTLSVKGGDEIEKYYIRKDKTIPISAFRDICENVALAHKEQCYFNDLKPKNMTFRSELIGKGKKVKLDKEPQAKLIDVDDFVTKDNATAAKRMAGGTPIYLTHGLYEGKRSGSHKLWRAADNYALLLSVAASTSVEVGIAMYDRATYNKFRNTKMHNFPTKGYMEYGHQETFEQWVQDFIKPVHQTNVLNFLAAPEVHPLAENVIDVIKWDN